MDSKLSQKLGEKAESGPAASRLSPNLELWKFSSTAINNICTSKQERRGKTVDIVYARETGTFKLSPYFLLVAHTPALYPHCHYHLSSLPTPFQPHCRHLRAAALPCSLNMHSVLAKSSSFTLSLIAPLCSRV